MSLHEDESVAADSTVALLNYVQEVAIELHPHRASSLTVTLDSALERELGFDSLGRVELIQRLERAFDVQLPEQLLVIAETPRDLLRGIHSADAPASLPREMQVRSHGLGASGSTPVQACTLLDVLEWHVQAHPERPHIHLYGEADHEDILTYAMLHDAARQTAAGLQAGGLQSGQTVALMLPTGREFFAGFFGILMAGGIPIPIYPPTRPSQIEEHLQRQAGILSNARCVLLITFPAAQRLARLLQAQVPHLRRVVTAQDLQEQTGVYVRPPVQAQDIAFVQYTSGSTGTPKGVVLTHANLLANIRAMNQVACTTSADVFVSWLPLYHDMGLIGAWLGSLYCAYLLVLMSPLAFLSHPARWLWTIHQHRGTISGGPNFAYELCVQKIDAAQLEGLDLSAWRLAFNGAEPVSPETIERFCDRFAAYGFRPEALLPVYGLAENSLGLAFPVPGRQPRIDCIKRDLFMRASRAMPAEPDDPRALRFVACGQPLPGHCLRIVDATGYEVPERQEGRVQFRGPSTTSGYFHNPEETRRLFHDDWLDSGDLAYMVAGEIYLTGRAKDVIIRAGRNLYPYEAEEAIGKLPHIRKGCVAVFGSSDPVSGMERVIVLAETHETEAGIRDKLQSQIDAVLIDLLGVPPDHVVLAPPHTVLKTSSGKIRRTACRQLYECGRIGERPVAIWWQVARLAMAGIVPQLRRLRQAATQVLYAAYVWSVFGLLGPVAWTLVVLLPRQAWRQTVLRHLGQLVFKLAGIPRQVQGLERLPRPEGPCVIVVNHASYLDALVLLATLPGDIGYVAKQELATQFLSRLPMRRLGVEFVERFDTQRGLDDTARVVDTVRHGRTVVFFPEGTFGREPGLRPFRMGAFVAATQAGVPVLPVAIRGTRSILRADQWFPRRATIRVTVGTPLPPQGTEWSDAIALRQAARAQILQLCGEPDLAPVRETDPALQRFQEEDKHFF
ncbi:2-succinylbenzoate--CoA ligase [Candidatus Entotheonellaceae bacterium PAL068K]